MDSTKLLDQIEDDEKQSEQDRLFFIMEHFRGSEKMMIARIEEEHGKADTYFQNWMDAEHEIIRLTSLLVLNGIDINPLPCEKNCEANLEK